MSDSSHPQSNDTPPPEVVQGWLSAICERLDARESLCRDIAELARGYYLDCDWQFVNRHLSWFRRWYTGHISTGRLMGRTGVKYKPPNITHWSE